MRVSHTFFRTVRVLLQGCNMQQRETRDLFTHQTPRLVTGRVSEVWHKVGTRSNETIGSCGNAAIGATFRRK